MFRTLNIAKKFLEDLNIDLPVLVDNNLNARAAYLYEERMIKINAKELGASYKKYASSLKDYIIIILCHEIGHYLDESLEETHQEITKRLTKMDTNEFTPKDVLKLFELNYSMENKAKVNGLKFVPQRLINEYNLLNAYNLNSTEFDIERRILMYQQNADEKRYMEKIAELQNENKKLRNNNIELMKENTELKLGKEIKV